MKTLFVGDICPSASSLSGSVKENASNLFGDTLSVFCESDFIFANIECAISESDNAIKKFGPNLKVPLNTAPLLKEIGVTVAGLSNNHVFDFGREGAFDTINALKSVGIDYTGFGDNYEDSRKNYTFEKDGEKICIIAVCEHEYSYALPDRMGSRPFDEFDTIEDIRDAKRTHDRVVVIYHGGKEHCAYPSPRLMRACRAMAKSGADMVLCQHSHCIGTYENYLDSHIIYGQGNFIFQPLINSEAWKTGLAISYDTKTNRIEFIPVRQIDGSENIRLVTGDKKEKILTDFAKRSEKIKTGEWKEEWHLFCESVKDNYTHNVARAQAPDASDFENDIFGHFLDCEAHTDVWRELFPTYNLTNEKD